MAALHSFWMAEALELERGRRGASPARTLEAPTSADFCVIGGGYTGLWTALQLKSRAPDQDVVLLESDLCGAGASGRNGGFASSWWNRLHELEQLLVAPAAHELALASSESLDALEQFLSDRDVDARFRRRGEMLVACTPAQQGCWRPALEACARAGRPERLVELSSDEARARAGMERALGGVFMPDAAAVQPALLVRALRQAAIDSGVRVYEGTAMHSLDMRKRIVGSARGDIRCGKVVLALGAWAASLRQLRLRLLPVSSHVLVTEREPDAVERLPWHEGELIADGRVLVHYMQATPDGRVAFGRGGGPLGVLGRVRPRVLFDAATADQVERDFRRFLPQLAGLSVAARWGGAVDRSPDHFPFFAQLDDEAHVLAGAGYSGSGLVAAHLGARILAALALEAKDRWSSSPLVGLRSRIFPPEPFRAMGGEMVRRAVERKENLEDEGRMPGVVTRALSRFVYFNLPSPGGARLTRHANRA